MRVTGDAECDHSMVIAMAVGGLAPAMSRRGEGRRYGGRAAHWIRL